VNFRVLLSLASIGLACTSLPAATINNISFKTTANGYTNDTIVGNNTSPLGITGKADLLQPFLNASDSSITLNYGNYYAIAFLGFGQLQGAGTVSFMLNNVTAYSANVTFPDPSASSPIFASFSLPGGDSLTVASTGLSADRIRISADGGGLSADGTADAFYALNFTSGTTSSAPEPATFAMFGTGVAALIAVRRSTKKSA